MEPQKLLVLVVLAAGCRTRLWEEESPAKAVLCALPDANAIRDIAGLDLDRIGGQLAFGGQLQRLGQVFVPHVSGQLDRVLLPLTLAADGSIEVEWWLTPTDDDGTPLPGIYSSLGRCRWRGSGAVELNLDFRETPLDSGKPYALILESIPGSWLPLSHLDPPQATGIAALWQQEAGGAWERFRNPEAALPLETWMLP